MKTDASTLSPSYSAPRAVLPALVLAELLGTGLWFSSNSALPALVRAWGLSDSDAGLMVSAVQAGFIVGTFLFALSNLADRFPAARVFGVCALAGAAANALFAFHAAGLAEALVWRFVTGVSLAGIYPVGMKLVVSWAPEAKGRALGWLVGALTLGTASPFLLAWAGADLPWQAVLASASGLAVLAGLIAAGIGDGPHLPPARKVELRMMWRVFRIPGYRGAALGYFGHMWELYAFWVLTPFLVRAGLEPLGLGSAPAVSLGTFVVIALGAVGCVLGGAASRRVGSLHVAGFSLAVSGTLCLLGPWLAQASPVAFLVALGVWGVFVVSDSPQFSALSAQACPPDYVATALTLQNSIGFAITIVAIELGTRLWPLLGPGVTLLLAPGPLLGLLLLYLPANRGPAVRG